MLLELTPDQDFFRETTAKFLAAQAPVDAIRGLRDDPRGFDREYWRRGAELGWTSLLVSEERGGGSISERSVADLALIAFEIGKAAAPGPFVPTNIVAAALDASGSHREVLDALLAGASIASWCLGEPPPGDQLGTIACEVRVDGDELVLRGAKRPVESAGDAEHLLVTARTGDGLSQVLVPRDAPGVTIEPLQTVDLTRRFSAVTFDNVRIPAAAAVGAIGGAEEQVERQLQFALVMLNAESVGAMQRAFDMTVEWSFDRYSFGRPLASYQELKHRFADMASWLQTAHALSDAAADAVQDHSPDAAELVSVAKAYIGQYGTELLHDCVQLHGGIGLTYEHDIHLFLRRVTLDSALFGTAADHRRRVGAIARGTGGHWMTDGTVTEEQAADESEDVAAFRAMAREWIRSNLGPATPHLHVGLQTNYLSEEEELATVESDRRLQRKLFDAGFAGLCVPVAYGGQGLTPAHQRAFNEELTGYEHPSRMQVPTFTPCLAVLLDFGTEEQKLQHIPAILRGEELWMQLLSEPSGGSDVAGALTTAVRDGDEWFLNGSKVWTTGAWWSDWGLCLARTNWDVPKHRGLTVFMMPLHQEGVDVQRIEMLNGSREFCQEFLTDVRIPDTDRIGPADDGWTIATRWMFHERMLYNSPLVTVPVGTIHGGNGTESVIAVARDAGRLDAPGVDEVIGEARTLDVARHELQRRILQGIATGLISDQSAAIVRLFGAVATIRMRTIGFELAGTLGAAWSEDDGSAGGAGIEFLMRQTASIGGGTTEMARNVISERVLGMPREVTLDRDIAFREVPRGPTHGR